MFKKLFERETVHAVGHYFLMLIALACVGFGMYLVYLNATVDCLLVPPGK